MQFHSPQDRLEINIWPWLLAAGLPAFVLVVLTAHYVNRSDEASRLPGVPARPPAAAGNQGAKAGN